MAAEPLKWGKSKAKRAVRVKCSPTSKTEEEKKNLKYFINTVYIDDMLQNFSFIGFPKY